MTKTSPGIFSKVIYWSGFGVFFGIFIYQITLLWIQHNQELTIQSSYFVKQNLKSFPVLTFCPFQAYKAESV